MRKSHSIRLLIGVAAALAIGAGGGMAGGLGCQATTTTASCETASYEKALQKAETTGLRVLIKVGAEWCSACNNFGAAHRHSRAASSRVDARLMSRYLGHREMAFSFQIGARFR